MKNDFRSFYKCTCAAVDLVALFYLDLARTLGIFGKLFLHTLSGLLIIAITGVHIATIANYELVLKSSDLFSPLILVVCLDYFSTCKVIAVFKALDMLNAKK